MKIRNRTLFRITFILIICIISNKTYAIPGISKWNIPTAYLDSYPLGGRIIVSNTASTAISANITFTRGYTPNGGPLEEVSLKVQVIYHKNNEVDINLMPEITINSNDFNSQWYFDKTISFTIPTGKVGGYVILKYLDNKSAYNSNWNYIAPQYSTTIIATVLSTPRFLSNMVGIDIATDDHVFYWDINGIVSSGYSTGSMQQYRLPYYYSLTSGKGYFDIVDIAINNSNWCYAWYKDGTVLAGFSDNLRPIYMPLTNYILPANKTPNDIVGISLAKNTGHCYTWYKDGTVSEGTPTNLAEYRVYTYTIAPGETYDNIIDVGIAASSGYCYVWYKDGKMSVGYSDDLDAYIPLKSM